MLSVHLVATRSSLSTPLRQRGSDLRFLRHRNLVNHQSRDAFPMVRRVAKSNLARLRTPIVQVAVVLPSEAHATMNLDRTIAALSEGIAAVRLGHRYRRTRIGYAVVERICGIVRGAARAFRIYQHVGAHVLDRLETTDGLAELLASFRVFHGDFEKTLHASQHLGENSDGRHIERMLDGLHCTLA